MLTLSIKKKWFDMILSGEKKEEYREVKPYYTTRLNKIFNMADDIPLDLAETEVRFTNGYGYKVPSFIADCHLEKRIGKEEWGAEPNKEYYVLVIEKIRWKSMDNLGGYLISQTGGTLMERIDCEKCINSEFVDGDKLRCRLKKCQPEYEDMREAREVLLSSFPGSFINNNDEFIADKKSNQYFILRDCEYPEDIDCKVLEWLSRAACKGQPYRQEWRNQKYRKRMLDGINAYMDTNFSEDEMMEIYTYLGNACNHKKTVRFIESGYDMEVLKK